MPKPCDSAFFAIVCEDRKFSRHIRICKNSGFSVVRDKPLGRVTVVDGSATVLDAARIAGGWLVRLHVKYYRHPFGPFSTGDALPGAR